MYTFPCQFQFTPLREGLHATSDFVNVYNVISIHAPARGASVRSVQSGNGAEFQFTPLREGLPAVNKCIGSIPISIHAPARGASFLQSSTRLPRLFQFTPLREGLQRDFKLSVHLGAFQFTPLREGLHFGDGKHQQTGEFQFTPLREGLRGSACHLFDTMQFQFTPLREGLQKWRLWRKRRNIYFNSRPCERGFVSKGYYYLRYTISIHAPARGASKNSGTMKNRQQ